MCTRDLVLREELPMGFGVAEGTLKEATAREPGWVEMRPRKRATCHERT
jgi:hypothetical protein